MRRCPDEQKGCRGPGSVQAQAEILAIPTSVWKVCRFHYSLSHFTTAVAMFLHGGPGVGGELCGPASLGFSSTRWGRSLEVHTWDTCAASKKLLDDPSCWQPSLSGKQEEATMDRFENELLGNDRISVLLVTRLPNIPNGIPYTVNCYWM